MFGGAALGETNLAMIATARSVGAAAKFTGSGGAIIALCPEGEPQERRLQGESPTRKSAALQLVAVIAMDGIMLYLPSLHGAPMLGSRMVEFAQATKVPCSFTTMWTSARLGTVSNNVLQCVSRIAACFGACRGLSCRGLYLCAGRGCTRDIQGGPSDALKLAVQLFPAERCLTVAPIEVLIWEDVSRGRGPEWPVCASASGSTWRC